MAKFSPFKFLQEVRDETDKVTWPTRRETAITTAMVFVMVAISSVFFLLADQAIRLIESRRLPLERLQTHRFPLREAERALRTLAGQMPGEEAVHCCLLPDA